MPHICHSCRKAFSRVGDLNSHLRQKKECQWLLKLRQPERTLSPPPRDYADGSDHEDDPPLLSFDDIAMLDAGAGENSAAADEGEDILMGEGEDEAEDVPAAQTSGIRSDRAHRATVEEELEDDEDTYVQEFPGAAKIVGWDEKVRAEYEARGATNANSENPWHPFSSKLEWDIAEWAKESDTGDNSLTRLLTIPGVVERLGLLSYKDARTLNRLIDHQLPNTPEWLHRYVALTDTAQQYDLYNRDILECLDTLHGNPLFADTMHYKPEKHFTDRSKTSRIYHGIHTARWMWKCQLKIKKGGTVMPVVFATDKTELTLISGDHTAYPLYMTSGLIDNSFRIRPSSHAWILVGYLPVAKLEGLGLSKEAARIARARLFHHCMKIITAPLVEAGTNGRLMTSGDGSIRECFPILACYVGDNPEQGLVCCTRAGSTCPICPATKEEFGDNIYYYTRDPEETLEIIREACEEATAADQEKALKTAGLTAVVEPFWAELPHCNIHEAITADVLHQLYQGVVKHCVSWVRVVMGDTELDRRFQCMPPTHGVRIFEDGISKLQRVSGAEHKNICKQLLGCMVGRAPQDAIRATRALLDFLYLAQYRSHSDETLQYLDDALDEFHRYKDVFLQLGARAGDHFNLPKLHALQHYADCIRLFGTTDNYNTEISERLHINLVKDAYRASNRKEALEQMGRWLRRLETIHRFKTHVEWRTSDPSTKSSRPVRPPRLGITIAKTASAHGVSIPDLGRIYGATKFTEALQTFVGQLREGEPRYTARQRDRNIALYVTSVDVWHLIKFDTPDVQLGTKITHHIARAYGKTQREHKADLPARFDTVIVNDTGAEGVGIDGLRVARLRVVFKIPELLESITFGEGVKPPGHLAYVEWFTRPRQCDSDHGMYPISYSRNAKGEKNCAIIEVANIVRICQIQPQCGYRIDPEWTSDNVLDKCNNFLLSNWMDQLAYQTIY
ncbi:hypothetical protein EIP86_010308 [Pleurotus ostreatoroseus]|nr:hypothetical protein EIP86_010308 [Pleurotus ostreatoroseus]